MLDEYTDEFGTNLESQIPEFNGQTPGYPAPDYQPKPYAPPAQPPPPPQPVYQQPVPPIQVQPAPVYVQTPPPVPPQPTPQPPPISQNQFFYPPQQPVYQQPVQPTPPLPSAPAARINSVFDEESRELNDIMKAEQNAGCLKNLLFIVICAVVVLGSFWLSYLVGAQFLLPNKQNPSFSVTKGLNKLKRLKNNLMSSQDIVKDEKAFTSYAKPPAPQNIVPPEVQYTPVAPPKPVAPPSPKPAPKPAAKPPQTAAAPSGTMYRVVVGSFDTKQEAQDVAENIRADGFPVYMYTADGKYRLQIGAFKSKALATSLMTKATEYGYNAFISIK
ncbi:MAG: SPOR domain-containing protein [Candidatus Margulisbacteria bacterium]|nr:SPOR domain-containing protein [Candidatus Margulisiibacteriota bacterium]